MPAVRSLSVFQPGLVGYDEALAAQKSFVEDLRPRGEPGRGVLLLLEHPPVVTIGRGAKPEHVLAPPDEFRQRGVELRETNRGGDVTYHGPGQIVGYPVVDLQDYDRDVHEHMRRIERVLIATLADYGIAGRQRGGYTGVWAGDGKIASIGIAVAHWIAYHGFALNVDPNLAHFGLIVPCGIRGVRITSMRNELGGSVDPAEVSERIVVHFCNEFRFQRVERRSSLPELSRGTR